jgi:hypothetical protein
MRPDLPHLPGILTADEVAQTAASIAAMQEPWGAIPWTPGEHTDLWNHVEGAMALLVGGEVAAAERAYEWAVTMQREDGSWPLKIVAGQVEDPSGEANVSAYLAVGLWHHWLIRRDQDFVTRYWPSVRRGLDFVVGMQLPFGGIAWSQEWQAGQPAKVNREALLAGSSSIFQSLRAGVALAELVGEPQPGWELAGGRLGHAVRRHRDAFLDKSTFSMDWYYPVLGGAMRGRAGLARLAERWDHFVRPGLGVLCVDHDPWVTGAETCELAMALEALGDHRRALELFADMQHLRDTGGRYWTGFVYPENVNWPVEHTTYTAAAVVLAADTLAGATAAAGIMRGATLPDFEEIGLGCGCTDPGVTAETDPSADGVAGVPAHPA